jgi:uncharacterized protein YdhG (YjbR/CyaY superfamily)
MDSRLKYNSVDEYISAQPENIQLLLELIRKNIKEAAPEAIELISYGMPAYKIHGILAYFAANKQHVGFYPTASPIEVFKDELTGYKTSKGAIQFPLKSGIPSKLVQKIIEFRVIEDEIKKATKNKKK